MGLEGMVLLFHSLQEQGMTEGPLLIGSGPSVLRRS